MRFLIIGFTLSIIGILESNAQGQSCDVSYKESIDNLVFTFSNSSKDTLFLFSTYFDNQYLSSKYLHRIDKECKTYKLSFLPLLPYIAAYLTDKIILYNENKIIMEGQTLYQFVKIGPMETFTLNLPYSKLFLHKDEKNNAVKDFSFEKVDKRAIKQLSLRRLKGKYCLSFEFALYKKVDLLLSRDLYINGGIKTYEQSKDFETVKVAVNLNHIQLPIDISK